MIIGLDLGDKYSHWALMTRESEEVQAEGRVATARRALKKVFGKWEPARIAVEVGTHSPWVKRVLESCGHEVLVANARKVRMIYTNEQKNDKVDAEMLARVARMDPNLLAPIEHRGEQAQADLAVLRSRDELVKARTALVNHVRNVVKSFGERLPKCDAHGFHRKVADLLPEPLRPALEPVVQAIEQFSKQIEGYDRQIKQLCEQAYPETLVLQEIKGVGPVTALAYVLTLEEPSRFPKGREVGTYLGLTPRRDQSGEQDPQLRITKAGNSFVRRLLVGAAQYILGNLNNQDSELRQWGLRLCGPKGENGKYNKRLKKRAVVAVARKLAVLLHRLWSTGEIFDPFYQRNLCADGDAST